MDRKLVIVLPQPEQYRQPIRVLNNWPPLARILESPLSWVIAVRAMDFADVYRRRDDPVTYFHLGERGPAVASILDMKRMSDE